MVILKNINRTDIDISADYYIEGREPKGFMRLRIADGEIIEHQNTGYGSSHVRRELERLARTDNPPVEKIVLWY